MFRWKSASQSFATFRPSVCIAGLIILVWCAAFTLVAMERENVRGEIFRETAHVAHVLEERVIRRIEKIDRTLRSLRSSYARNAGKGSWSQILSEGAAGLSARSTISIIDENGILLASNIPSPDRGTSLAGAEYFRIHANEPADILFIGRPLVAPEAYAGHVLLTRKIEKPDGNWGGVIAISLDPSLMVLANDASPAIGESDSLLIGRDGIVRFSYGRAPDPGSDLSQTPLFRKLEKENRSSFWHLEVGANGGQVTSYRVLTELPLVVAVTAADEENSAGFILRYRIAFAVAGLLSLVLLISAALAARNAISLERIRSALQRSEARSRTKSRELELTLNNMSQGIMMVDGDGHLAVINRQAVTLLGLPASYLKRPPDYTELIEYQRRAGGDVADWGVIQRLGQQTRARSEVSRMATHEWTTHEGTVLEVQSQLLADGGFVRTFADVTHRHQAEARINHLSRHDPLTKLANRAMFHEMLERVLLPSAQQNEIAVLCINLDLFRSINDALGQSVGDKLLQVVAGRLQLLVGPGGIVARLGGDEFALAQRIGGTGDAAELADSVIKKLSEPLTIEGHSIAISASIGIALAMKDATTAEDLLQAANLALWEAKAADRCVYRFYEPEMQTRSRQRRLLEVDLRQGLNEGQFELHYQPLYRLDSQAISGFEALIRWRHPQKGLVPPSDFVSVAEDIGLIEQIGNWALGEVCRELARLPNHIKVSVNLSPLQFRSRALVQQVREALAEAGVAAHRLVLEITESTLLRGDKQALRQLHELRSLGLRIAMDDFGTGYSSLSYLMRFPFDSIKIDRSFVEGIGHVPGSMAIIRAITELASSLGMTTIAEGVETQEQLRELMTVGCCEAQGYWWSRPLPAREARALCARENVSLPKAVTAGQAAA